VRAREIATAAALLLGGAAALGAGPAAAAERVCGTVLAGGAPVRGAHVAAAERGLVALTDSAGAFCFEGVEAGGLVLRVFALGFQPAERLVAVAPAMAPVRFELQPLRGGSGSWTGGGSEGSAAPPPAAPPPAAPSGPAAALFAAVPMLVLPADSAWLAATHKDAKWDTLKAVHTVLVGQAGGPPLEPRTWRELGEGIHDLRLRECEGERPRKRPLGKTACAYLERGAAVAELRAARLTGKQPSRDTRLYLEQLAGGGDPQASAWARGLLTAAKAPPEAPAVQPVTPPAGTPGGAPPAPGEKR
jgi:hypothetical protein